MITGEGSLPQFLLLPSVSQYFSLSYIDGKDDQKIPRSKLHWPRISRDIVIETHLESATNKTNLPDIAGPNQQSKH